MYQLTTRLLCSWFCLKRARLAVSVLLTGKVTIPKEKNSGVFISLSQVNVGRTTALTGPKMLEQ